MKLRILFSAIAIASICSTAFSQEKDFFSTEESPKLFTFGVRAGLNTSNRTMPGYAFNAWNVNSWGTGIDVGAVATINFRDYLALQPGFFFESRSGNFSYASEYITNNNTVDTQYQLGHYRSYNFTIPIMGIVRFNLSDDLRLLGELGPYLQFVLSSSDANDIVYLTRYPAATDYYMRAADQNKFDVGFKIGTGLQFREHYSFEIHYMAGMVNAWKDPNGGHNKAWTFTLGYDF